MSPTTTLNQDGTITKDGALLGSYGEQTRTLILPEGTHPNRKSSILDVLDREGHMPETIVEVPEKELRESLEEAEDRRAKAEAESVPDSLTETDTDFSHRTGIKPPPLINPQFGDKTKALVEWRKKHRPDFYRHTYGIVTSDATLPVFNDEGEQVGTRTVDLGRRIAPGIEYAGIEAALETQGRSWDA